MSASSSSTITRRRKKSTDSEETGEEKISRALKRRKMASKINNNSEDEEMEIKMDNDDSIAQFQEDQVPSLPKRTRGSRRNSQNNANDTEVKDLVDQDRGNSSSDTEKSGTNNMGLTMTINKNVVSLDEIRSRALYKLKMASCQRVEFSFCMTKHKHNVFAMDATVNNALFAAGGSGGNLSLFQLGIGLYSNSKLETTVMGRKNTMKYLPPFLTLSVHDSWISGVKFLDIDRDDESYSLLTTSDDAKLKLWSFDTSLKEEYQKLAHINPVSEVNTESGIYSVDAFHHRILTSCKNGEVVLHELAESEIRTVQHYIAHTDVAKHVRWRDPNVFATCGNDKKINVYDIRVATQPKVTSYENAHSLSINTVAWQHGEPFRLISSGFDQVINIWDLKKPDKPLFSITDHQGKNGRSSAIFHPIFAFAGAAIMTASDASKDLYVFDTVSGKLTRKFELGYTANSIYADWPTEYIVTAQNQRLNLMLPKAKRVTTVVQKRSNTKVTKDEDSKGDC